MNSIDRLRLDRLMRLINEWEERLRSATKYENKWHDVLDAYYEIRNDWAEINVIDDEDFFDDPPPFDE